MLSEVYDGFDGVHIWVYVRTILGATYDSFFHCISDCIADSLLYQLEQAKEKKASARGGGSPTNQVDT
jgi:hypothetical protein